MSWQVRNTPQDVGRVERSATASIRTWLTICGAASLVPLILVLAYFISLHYAREKAAAFAQLQSTNRALLQVLDRELSAKTDVIQIYATAQALRDKDFARFYEQARNGLASIASRGAIFLADGNGNLILHTDKPLGAALPSLAPAEGLRRVFENRQTYISNYSISNVSGTAEVSVTVPVLIQDQPVYALGLTTPVAELADIFKRQQIPQTRLASIVDRNQTVLARTRSAEQFVGTRPNTGYSRAVADSAEGILDGTASAEGVTFLSAWMRSTQSGWTIGMGADVNEILAPVTSQMRLVGGAAAAAAALGLLVIFVVARRFGNGTAELRAAAMAMRAEAPISRSATGVREYDELSSVLTDTSSRLRALTDERTHAEQTLSKALNNLSDLYMFTEKRFRAEALEEVYEAALSAISSSLRCSRAAILIADDSNVMRFVAWRGLSERYRLAVEGHSPWQADDTDPQIVAISDIVLEPLPEALMATIRDEGIGALALFPLSSTTGWSASSWPITMCRMASTTPKESWPWSLPGSSDLGSNASARKTPSACWCASFSTEPTTFSQSFRP